MAASPGGATLSVPDSEEATDSEPAAKKGAGGRRLSRRLSTSPAITKSTSSASLRVGGEATGRLRVRCVSARQLAAGDPSIFGVGTSDPYVSLYLRDHCNHQRSKVRHTRIVKKTLNPQWREEFWFAVQNHPEHLVLHLDVYDYDEGEDDDFLGHVTLPLDLDFLKAAARQRQVREVKLESDPSRSKLQPSGCIRFEVSWEPKLALHRARMEMLGFVKVMARSPQTLRVIGIGQLGTAGLMLLVAQQCRWLCRGASWDECVAVTVPGTGTCALLASMCSWVAFGIHFLGSAGLFGPTWKDHPPSLAELAGSLDDEEEGTGADHGQPQLQMQVESVGMMQWNVSMATSLLPKVNLSVIRLAVWYAHLAAFFMSAVAAGLAWMEDAPGSFLADAAYLNIAALLSLGGAVLVFWSHKRRFSAETWESMEDHQAYHHGMRSGGRSRLGSDLFPRVTFSTGMQSVTEGAEQLAQPLLDYQQRLRQHLEAMQVVSGHPGSGESRRWMQPLLNAVRGTAGPSVTPPLPVEVAEANGVPAKVARPVLVVDEDAVWDDSQQCDVALEEDEAPKLQGSADAPPGGTCCGFSGLGG